MVARANLEALKILAQDVAESLSGPPLKPRAAHLLLNVVRDARLLRISLEGPGRRCMLASSLNLSILDSPAALSLQAVHNNVAGLALWRNSCFQALFKGPTRVVDVNEAHGMYGCSSLIVIPIPAPTERTRKVSQPNDRPPCLGVLSIGRSSSDDVQPRAWAQLMVLACLLGIQLSRSTQPDAAHWAHCVPAHNNVQAGFEAQREPAAAAAADSDLDASQGTRSSSSGGRAACDLPGFKRSRPTPADDPQLDTRPGKRLRLLRTGSDLEFAKSIDSSVSSQAHVRVAA
jgi:hypothetical protein